MWPGSRRVAYFYTFLNRLILARCRCKDFKLPPIWSYPPVIWNRFQATLPVIWNRFEATPIDLKLPPSDFFLNFSFFFNFHQLVRLFGIILVCINLLNPKGLCASHKQREIIVWYWSQLIPWVCLLVPCSQLHMLGCT